MLGADVSPASLRFFQIEEVTFKNYYTAYVTVRLLRRNPEQEAPAKWCTAVRDLPLMDNPHTEGGSQDYYTIHRTQVGFTRSHLKSGFSLFNDRAAIKIFDCRNAKVLKIKT